jgi:exodeoxyribonuclease V gamma subunit
MLTLTLEELIRCWSDPAKFHCRQVLSLSIREAPDALEDVEPFVLDHLGRYHLREALLEQRSAHPDRPMDAIRARVRSATPMPPGELTQRWSRQAEQEIQPLVDRLQAVTFAPPRPVRLQGVDWRLTGTLDRLGTDVHGEAQWSVRPAKVRAKDRIAAWIRHLVAAAAGQADTTHVLGLDRSFRYVPVAEPLPLLEWLIDGYRQALHAPFPYFPRAAEAWWKASQGADPGAALRQAQDAFMELDTFGESDATSPHVALLWRGREPLVEQADRFAALVQGLWAPMTSAELRK